MAFLPGTDRSVCEMEDVMKIDTQIVDRYLSGKPLLTDEEDRIPLDQSALVMDRREVVAELKTRTLASLQQFPSFNPALFQALFPALGICQKRLHGEKRCIVRCLHRPDPGCQPHAHRFTDDVPHPSYASL